MTNRKRGPTITPENLEEAAALKAIYVERAKLSQAEFGAQSGIGTQGMVWQYLNGKAALHLKAAVQFALFLGCSIDDFSPRLAKEQRYLSMGFSNEPLSPTQQAEYDAHMAEEAERYTEESKTTQQPIHYMLDAEPLRMTAEELLAAYVAKLVKEGHTADIEAAPSDLKRALDKALRPNARIEIETPLPLKKAIGSQ